MKKQELKARLIIANGELQDSINYEQGCFDEIAQRIFMLALGCDDMVAKDSEDVEIKLDKSIDFICCLEKEYLNGIYLSKILTEAHIAASSLDGSESYVYDIEEVEREDIIKIVKELIRMCDL